MTTRRMLAVGPDEPVDEVTAVVHEPTGGPRTPAVLLTHGAGGALDGAGLVALADGLAESGHAVVRANLPYREAGRASPPRAERAVPGFRALADSARELVGPRLVVGGKSYGGRVASLAVADGLEAEALVFYGYPLHPPGKPDRLRVEHWPAISVPCLFLQGTRDPFGAPALFEAHLDELGASGTVHVVEGGDHSLAVRAMDTTDGRRRPAEATMVELAPIVAAWLDQIVAR